MKQPKILWILALATIWLAGCKKDDDNNNNLKEEFSVDWFYQQMKTIQVEVAYEEGAEPFMSRFNANDDLWALTRNNLEALFSGRPEPIEVNTPLSLNEMTSIPNQNKDSYTLQDIVDYSKNLRVGTNTQTDGNIFILFLDGFYQEDDTNRTNVLGVNIVGTTITAIFKPVVTSSGGTLLSPNQHRLVEQTTIIHELGHALGLVNNGVQLTSQHHDADHGAHCTNTDCVMYFQNEGSGAMANFVQSYLGTGTTILFGPECIADCEAYFP